MSDELTLDQALLSPEPVPPTQREYRLGVITVSFGLMEALDVKLDVTDLQGKLRDTGVFDLLKEKLLLPASYSIFGVFFQLWQNTWDICVESPDLPVVPRSMDAPHLTPLYQRTSSGTTRLLKIKIEGRWERTYSPDELTLERL